MTKEDLVLTHDYYVQREVYRLKLEAGARRMKHYAEWERLQAELHVARRNLLARWAGDRLIGAGEWLRERAGQCCASCDGCATSRYRSSV